MTQLLVQSVGFERQMAFHCLLLVWISSNVREYGFRNPGNFCYWNPGSCPWETEIQPQESGIPLTFAIRNPSSAEKDLESTNWNPESRIPDCLAFLYTCKGIRIPESRNFCQWNTESLGLESGIQLQETGTPLTIGIRNPSSTGKDLESSNWNPESGIHGAESRIHDCLGSPLYMRQTDSLRSNFKLGTQRNSLSLLTF